MKTAQPLTADSGRRIKARGSRHSIRSTGALDVQPRHNLVARSRLNARLPPAQSAGLCTNTEHNSETADEYVCAVFLLLPSVLHVIP